MYSLLDNVEDTLFGDRGISFTGKAEQYLIFTPTFGFLSKPETYPLMPMSWYKKKWSAS